MAKENNLLGVVSVEFGVPGDGIMGAVLTAFTAVEVGSTTMSGAEANQETIDTEQEDGYLTLTASATPTTLTVRLFEVFGADAVLLMGGTFAADKYEAPITIPETFLSFRLTTKDINGKTVQLDFPYAKVVARHEGTITKNNLLALEVVVTANTPVESGGTKNAPYSIAVINTP